MPVKFAPDYSSFTTEPNAVWRDAIRDSWNNEDAGFFVQRPGDSWEGSSQPTWERLSSVGASPQSPGEGYQALKAAGGWNLSDPGLQKYFDKLSYTDFGGTPTSDWRNDPRAGAMLLGRLGLSQAGGANQDVAQIFKGVYSPEQLQRIAEAERYMAYVNNKSNRGGLSGVADAAGDWWSGANDFVVPAVLSAVGMNYLGGAGAGGGAAEGAAAGAAGGAAGGTGLTIPAGAGEVLGVGGGAALPLGSGITPGVASTGIGGGALGTGIGAGAAGSIGALGALQFSPAAMQALQSGGQALPTLGGGASGGASAPAGNAAGGLRVGQGASRMMGLPSAASGGLPAGSGITVPVTSADAGAAAAGQATTGAAAGAQPTVVDSIIKQLKDNALGLGISGAGLMMQAKRTPMPNEQQLQGLGAESAAVARQLISQYQSGQLSQGQQASLDQQVQHAKNQITNYFASIGQADSTAHMQALQQVDQTSLQIKQQMLDTALQQGLQAIGVAQGPLNTIAQYQLGQDRQLADAFGRFASSVGSMFGRSAGQQQPTTQPQTTASAYPNIIGVRG